MEKREKLSENRTFMSREHHTSLPEIESNVWSKGAKHIQEPEILRKIDLEKSDGVEPELSLWLNDGQVVGSQIELTEAIKKMSSKLFVQHMDNKDITDWVREILGKPELATALDSSKSRKDAINILEANKEPVIKPIRLPHEEIHEAIESIKTVEETSDQPVHNQELTLDQRERELDLEEERLNKRRIALTNQRYKLIKERGELEKKKFEEILENHEDNLEPTMEYQSNTAEETLAQAKNELSMGNIEQAMILLREIKGELETNISSPDSKKLEYEIAEFETDLKLASLA